MCLLLCQELVHEKEALQKRVQEQLLQISALRNQLDEMRHWTGPTDPNTSAASAADLRDQLDTEREKLEKKEEEVVMTVACVCVCVCVCVCACVCVCV